MQKSLLALAAGCLYVALGAWLVDTVGAAHREALRKATPSVAKSVEAAAEPPAEAAPERLRQAPGPAPLVEQPSAIPPDPKTDLGKAPSPDTTNVEVARDSPAPEPAPAAVAETALKAVESLWNDPVVTRKWSLASLTAEEETRLGRGLNALILALNPRAPDGPDQARVENAAGPLLAHCRRKELKYEFFILDSEEVNAFSHPGGFVYVTTGLLAFIGKDEDCALQFVLGHEIAHVDDGHALRCLLIPQLQERKAGTVELIYKLIIPFGYTNEQEFQADRWAYDRVTAFGCGRYDSLKFIRRFEQYAKLKGFPSGHAPSMAGENRRLLDNHYRSHPAAHERRSRLEAVTTLEKPKAG